MSGVTASSERDLPRRTLSFRTSRVRWPEWVVAISALVLLISLIGLKWFTFHPASGGLGPKEFATTSEGGWSGLSHGHWLLLITILAGFALFILQATRRSPAIPVTLSALLPFLGALSAIWLIIRVALDPPAGAGRNLGAWLALASAIVLTWGAYESIAIEGIDPEDGPGEIPVTTFEEMARERASEPGAHS